MQPLPTFVGLPTELILLIISELTLCDLGSLSLTNSTLRQPALYTATRHKHRKILQRCLGWRWNVLDVNAWSSQPFQDIPRPVECFGRVEEPVEARDLVEIADLCSRLAHSLYFRYDGFIELHRGALPGHHLEQSDTDSQIAKPISGPTAQRAYALHLFLLALLYSAIRALSRRSQSSSSREREADEWSSLQLQRNDIEAVMEEQYRRLKKAIMRCDPLEAHVRTLSDGSESGGTTQGKGKGKAKEMSTLAPRTCLCHSRTHAAWYSIVWHHLVVRYRRFVTPQDQEHITYRVILFAQPSFPSVADGFGEDCFISQSQSSGPFSWLWTKRGGYNEPSTLSSFPRSGLPLFNTPPTLPDSVIPPNLPLSTLHSLNPDSLLFTLTESPTFSQTKSAFGLSEFALAPGLSRLWAGWIGYSWGEGGAEWSNEEMKAAEIRMASRPSDQAQSDVSTEVEIPGQHQTGPALVTRKLTGRLSEAGVATMPVEVILLGHARWRARQLLAIERRAETAARRLAEDAEGADDADEQAFAAMNHQNAAFDVHFVRRALQIQQWALQSYESTDSASGAAPLPTTGTVYGQTIPAGGLALAPGAARILPGQVHPSSPFLTVQGLSFFKSSKNLTQSSAQLRNVDPREQGLRAVPDYAWRLVGASLLSFLDIPDLLTARSSDSQSEDPHLYRRAVLEALGDLHAGLLPDFESCRGADVPEVQLPCAENPIALHAASTLRFEHIAAAQKRAPRTSALKSPSNTPLHVTNLSRLGLGRRPSQLAVTKSNFALWWVFPVMTILVACFYIGGYSGWTKLGTLVEGDL